MRWISGILIAIASPVAGAAAQEAPQITWSATDAGSKTPHFTIQATIGSNSMLRSGNMDEIPGVRPALFNGRNTADVHFTIPRDAGALDCTGTAGQGRGTGNCTFRASPTYAAEIARRGIARPDGIQLVRLALSDVGVAFIDSMRGAGVSESDAEPYIHLRNHDVAAAYIRDLRRAGVPDLDAESVIRLRNHDVTPAFVTSIKTAGVIDLGAEGLIRMRNHGVDAAFVRQARTAGVTDLSPEQLVWHRSHGFKRD